MPSDCTVGRILLSSMALTLCSNIFFYSVIAQTSPELNASRSAEEELEKYKKVLEEGGVSAFQKFFQTHQDDWKNIPLDIAVIGNTGVGKSSFINAIRRMTADEDGAAAVGVTETTATIEFYLHPNNSMLKFWDLPGAGTPNFPKASYLHHIDVDKYDFFVLITASRFTENDLWLAGEFRTRKKQFFFARNKIGQDIDNNKRSNPRTHNPHDVVKRIRHSTRDQLDKNGFQTIPIFLIDTFDTTKFDFADLELRLLNDYPELKRSAMILSLLVTNEKVLGRKVEELRSRIWQTALYSGVVGAVPVPGVSLLFDVGVILGQLEFYRDQLGLDAMSLHRYARHTKSDYQSLKDIVDSQLGISFFTAQGVKEFVRYLPNAAVVAAGGVLEEFARYVPFIGSAISSTLSYSSTNYILHQGLDRIHSVAKEVLNHPLEHGHILKKHDEL